MRLIHGDSDVFRLLESALRSAQYVRMRSAIACRFFSVSRRPSPALVGVLFVSFAGGVCPFCLDDTATIAAGNGSRGTALAGRFAGVAGTISMPNISERSSLASTFAPAGRLPFFERSDPASAIKSC